MSHHATCYRNVTYVRVIDSMRVGGQVRRVVIIALLLLVSMPDYGVQAQSTDQPPDDMAARVLACTTCHGIGGRGTNNESFPRLAGKPAGYLFNQLVAFRNGRRRYPPMNYLLAFLPDPYLQAIADYFAAENPPLPPPTVPIVSKDMLALGKSIVTSGDPDRGIPACSGCHNPNFTGMEPAIPGLLGLHAELHQRAAWRLALRHPHGGVARLHANGRQPSLTEKDVTAVAAWTVATLPAPANATPVSPQGSLPMPLPCGSEPKLIRVLDPCGSAVGDPSARLDAVAEAQPALNDPAPGCARGEYLARAGDCMACHTAPGNGMFLAGGRAMPTPFGTIVLVQHHARYLRNGPIGSWTADAFLRNAMHTGRSRDGGLIYPAMPFGAYTKVTRARTPMRSSPICNRSRRCKAAKQAARSAFPLRQPLADPRLAHAVLQGRRATSRTRPSRTTGTAAPILVQGLGHCAMCHSAINALGGNSESKAFEGGSDPDAELVRARRLTSNKEAGLGDLEHRRHRQTICATGCPTAAPSTGRWRKSSITACNT